MGSALYHTISFSDAAVILAQLLTSSSLKHQSLVSRSDLVKVPYPLEFIKFHLIVILIWNEWFGWLHTIFIWNRKNPLLSFDDFIFPHTSPIIWLLFSFHLFCLNFSFFFNLMSSYPLSMLCTVGVLLELNDISNFPLSLVGWNIGGYFSAQEVARRFDWL